VEKMRLLKIRLYIRLLIATIRRSRYTNKFSSFLALCRYEKRVIPKMNHNEFRDHIKQMDKNSREIKKIMTAFPRIDHNERNKRIARETLLERLEFKKLLLNRQRGYIPSDEVALGEK
jgi:hypothetical protein